MSATSRNEQFVSLLTRHFVRLGPLAIPQKKKVVKKQRAREKFDESQKVRPKEVSSCVT